MQIYRQEADFSILTSTWAAGKPVPADAVWIDLLEPTREQEQAVESFIGMEIPTREEMSEIEVSNRLYDENGALFMTATMLTKVDSGQPETHAATFIVTEKCLITVRYVDTTSFRRVALQLTRNATKPSTSSALFLMVVEAIINRQADILERMDREVDRITRMIFCNQDLTSARSTMNYRAVLDVIGRCGDITAKIHESLVTFSRVIVFASHHAHAGLSSSAYEAQITSIHRDIAGLSDHGTHLASRLNFLLDATLGMISIQQNGVFRVLSTASLIFLPPTLVAGIYGMNFSHMPEIEWIYGYPMAIGMMLVAAILPLAYLRHRRLL